MFLRVLLALAILVRTAHASECDPAEVTELRDHLTSQSGKANTWNFVWRLTFTVAAIGTGVAGALDILPSRNLRHGLYASSGKATIGALARWILPLRIHVPATSADACVDLAALRKEVKRVAHKERGMFWLGHIGGMLVNLGGAAYVYYYDGIGKAALSAVIGYPVGLLSNYTMPRGSWKLYREREASWQVTTVGVLPRRGDDGSGWVLGLGGTW